MAYSYDDENIFAKILRGEIPNDTVFETEHSLAFNDIRPQAPIHVLVIPRGKYVNYDDFAANASDEEILDYTRAIAKVCEMKGVEAEGFRMISNAGHNGVQEVPHLHVHILGGRNLGRMLTPA
ncbi:histidine triad (HIT) family protein [Salipiger thiooxidans]|uniref:Histidine triad (HIT) family protein n=1 Tax=Salipiger thiooxidans TaxID=282683 RepID=A0A1G7E2D2_9RHOB|nr:histidine triad nucleotide-binding protein [Salipiger thiooxidans]SDE57873.1 histidine triad (HIT) family protein [Salipiger thiooxidans]